MVAWLRHVWQRLLAELDDALPMPPDQRAARDWSGETSGDEAGRRRRRLGLHLFEKRGKGGFR